MRNRYREAGAELHILAAGTTGYGEMLFAKAFSTESHTVETGLLTQEQQKNM